MLTQRMAEGLLAPMAVGGRGEEPRDSPLCYTACPPGLRCRNLVTLAASTAARTHGGPERRSVAHAEPVEDLNA